MKLFASKVEKVIWHKYHPLGAGVMDDEKAPPPQMPRVSLLRLKLAYTVKAVDVAS